MALRIPRLPRGVPIVDGNGAPTQTFQQWWQSVAESVEGSINDISEILIRLGLAEETADGALQLAESAINPDGTIKTSKVLTESIIPEGVTQGAFAQLNSGVPCPDGVETQLLSIVVNKSLADSDIELVSNLRMTSNDDIIGSFIFRRNGDLLDSAPFDMRTNDGTQRNIVAYSFMDDFAPVGSHTYSVSFTRSGGASVVGCTAGSSLISREFLR